MSKKFSPEEKLEIRQTLINVFERKLSNQKPSKITIDELVQEAGIAKGSFYQFFPSKEVLFVQVINQVQDDMLATAQKIIKEKRSSEKDKLIKILNILLETLQNSPWLQNLPDNEWEKIIRRLPQDLKLQLQKQDKLALNQLLKELELTPTIPLEELVVIIEIVTSSASRKDDFGPHYTSASHSLITCLVEQFFKEKKHE